MKILMCLMAGVTVWGGALDHAALRKSLEEASRGFAGRVGVCVQDAGGVSCVDGDSRYSMQSVVKLVTSVAVMDAGMRLDEPVVVKREDLSVFVQPIAKLVTTSEGYRTTVGDLVRRAIVDSDSAAVDILIRKLGGTAKVQACLERLKVRGIRVDRDERHLQTEITGLEWKAEYVDPEALERAIAAVPKERRDAKWSEYQKDVRDTATPRGMTEMLWRLATGRLVGRESGETLMKIMEQTATFPDRLKAGAGPGWVVGHKTGSSGKWNGVTVATNDVGVFRAPDGGMFAITVFLGDSREDGAKATALMARLAKVAVAAYH